MQTSSQVAERRRDKRFKVLDGGVALVTPPGPHSTIVGNIIDISMNGLAFQYLSDKPIPAGATELTIASARDKFYLRGLPVKAISDFEIAKVPFGSLSPRRHGLEFGDLTAEQASHLGNFIATHAEREV
jgi:hypothetical protein